MSRLREREREFSPGIYSVWPNNVPIPCHRTSGTTSALLAQHARAAVSARATRSLRAMEPQITQPDKTLKKTPSSLMSRDTTFDPGPARRPAPGAYIATNVRNNYDALTADGSRVRVALRFWISYAISSPAIIAVFSLSINQNNNL